MISNAFTATVDRKRLADVLGTLGKVTEKRNTIPILSHILVEAGRDVLTLTATDLDIVLTVELPAHCQPGTRVALDLAALTAAVKKSKAEHATLTDVGGAVVLQAGGTARLASLPAADFPTMARGDLGQRFAVPVAQLRDDLARVRVAMSNDETRYYLRGVFMHRTPEGTMKFAATDGHRLAVIERPAPERMPETFADAIMPQKTVDVLQFIAKRDKAATDVALAFSSSKVDIRLGRWCILSKLVDGTFPDYSRVIPSGRDGAIATVDAEGFADLVKQSTAHVTGKIKATTLSWHSRESWVTAYAVDADNGAGMAVGEGEFEATHEKVAGEYVTGFNAVYLTQLLACCTGRVEIIQQDATAPAKLMPVDQPEFLMVLMPMRTDSGYRTPEAARRLSRTPVDILREDLPRVESAIEDRAKRKRERARVGAMVTAAIDHLAGGGNRRAARLAVLHLVAELRGNLITAERLKRAADLTPATSFRAWEAGLAPVVVDVAPVQPVEIVPAERVQDPVEAAACLSGAALVEAAGEAEALNEAEPVVVISEAVEIEPVETPDEYVARVRANEPMFRTLQDFKAAAGVGSQWRAQFWADGKWNDSGVRTVARVQARDIAFIREAVAPDVAARVGREKAGLSWFGFPKSGAWRSDAEGLVTLYQCGTPHLRYMPLVDQAPEAEQLGATEAPAEPVGDDSAVLRAMVLELTARLDRLESASQSVTSEPGVEQGEAPESSPAVTSADQAVDLGAVAIRTRTPAHEKAIRRAWAERRNARNYRRQSEANFRLAMATEAKVGKLTARVGRLNGVLAGRKAQLARALADLGFARSLGAVLQRERDQAAAAQGIERSPVRLAAVTYDMGARKAG